MDNAKLSEIKELFATQEATTEVVEPIEDETGQEPDETVLEVTEEVEEEAEEETEEVEAQADDEPYTMKTLSQEIDLPISDLYDVLIPMDGENESISIGEIKNSHQNLIREKAALEEQLKGQPEQPQAQQLSNDDMEAMLEMASVEQEIKNTNWQELEEFDAGDAALKRQKLTERQNIAMHKMQQSANNKQQAHNTMLATATTKMYELIPEWKDDTVKATEEKLVDDLMTKAGYPAGAYKNVTDPIATSLLRELAMLRNQKTEGRKVLNKVNKATKVLRGGGGTKPKPAQVTEKLVSKAKTTKNRHDQEAAIKAIMGVKQSR